MSKGLEAFKKFCDDVVACVNSGGIAHIDMKNKEIIEKELKVLKIIKENEVDMKAFNDLDSLEDYNYYCTPSLTQEEYNLLREVLL